MRKSMIIIGILLALFLFADVSNIYAVNDVCVRLNGGENVAYIGEYNTLEIWIANDVEIKTLQFPMEICWSSGQTIWHWHLEYGDQSPFQRHGEALTHLILFASDLTFDNQSCETFAAGATEIIPMNNLQPGSSRLLYSMEFGLPSQPDHVDNIVIQPFAYFAGTNWFFTRYDYFQFPPDFCGDPVSNMSNPSAPPVTFPIVNRTVSLCGDVNCDGNANVSDAVWIINYVFISGNAPCDEDGDGVPDC